MTKDGLLLILLSLLTISSFGQESERYQLYSQTLNQIFHTYKAQDKRLIILDSTYITDIELADIGKYLNNRTKETLTIAGQYYPYPELLNEIWTRHYPFHVNQKPQ